MSTAMGHADLDETTRSCVTELVCQRCDVKRPITDTEAFCEACGKCFDVAYDYELAKTRLRELPMSERPRNIWRLSELLPIRSAHAQAEVGQISGMTPLIPANRLGERLGLRKLYLKDDSTQRPSLSYKDRVVSSAIARALELGKTEIGCVSTGNVGTAVASLGAKAGLTPYVFYPNRLEETKARVCRALGARVCQVAGNYDEANRECRKVAAASGLEFANITLRPFYAEGAKTAIFEIVEQLGWQAPDHIVSATAGGTLSSRLHKGLVELETVGLAETSATKMHIAQPEGCSPIADAILAGEPEIQPRKPDDDRAFAGNWFSRGRLSGDRRRSVAQRQRSYSQRRGDIRGDRFARRNRGNLDRARGRNDDRGAEEAGRVGRRGSRRDRGGDHHGQRAEDARRSSGEALAFDGGVRAGLDACGAERASARSGRSAAARVADVKAPARAHA